MPGSAEFAVATVQAVAEEFGWTVAIAGNLREAATANKYRRASVALFHREALGRNSWSDAVRVLQSALPDVRPVACHAFSEPVDWPTLCDAGAFHSLRLPLNESEVRQSFGFVWESEQRIAEAVRRVPLILPVRTWSIPQRIRPAFAHDIRALTMPSAAR